MNTSPPTISNITARTIRKYTMLYLPFVFAVSMMSISVLELTIGTPLNSAILLFATAALLSVQSLHRAHEHTHGLSTFDSRMWPAFAFATAIGIMMLSLQQESPLLAALGVIILLATALITAR